MYQKCVDKDRKQWKQRGLGCAGTELGYVDWPGKLQAIMQIAVVSYASLDLHSILSFYSLATFLHISWWFVRLAKKASCTRTYVYVYDLLSYDLYDSNDFIDPN